MASDQSRREEYLSEENADIYTTHLNGMVAVIWPVFAQRNLRILAAPHRKSAVHLVSLFR